MDIIVAVIGGIILGIIGMILFRKFNQKPIPTPYAESCPYKVDVAVCSQDPIPPEAPSSIAEIVATQVTSQSSDVTTPVLKFPTKPKKTIKASKKPSTSRPKKKP